MFEDSRRDQDRRVSAPDCARVKEMYPIYRVDDRRFRIGAQLGVTAEFDDPDGQVWSLVQLLNGRPTSDVVNQMREMYPSLSEQDVLEGIATLDDEQFLEAAEPDGQSDEHVEPRYLPNVRYFSRFYGLTGNRYHPHDRLRAATVLLLGLGGAGSNFLTLLAGVGVGRVVVADYDVVEEGNLGRQFLYRESDVGSAKAEAAKDALGEMNPQCSVVPHVVKVETIEDVLPLLDGVDLCICAIDEPPFVAQRLVNSACVKTRVPCVYGLSQVSRGRVFTVRPFESGCFDCLNINYSMHDPVFVQQFRGFMSSGFDPPAVAYGPGLFQLAGLVVDEAVRLITGYAEPRSVGVQLEVDYEAGTSFKLTDWQRRPGECPTCGSGSETDWEIFSYYHTDVRTIGL